MTSSDRTTDRQSQAGDLRAEPGLGLGGGDVVAGFFGGNAGFDRGKGLLPGAAGIQRAEQALVVDRIGAAGAAAEGGAVGARRGQHDSVRAGHRRLRKAAGKA